MKIGFIREKNKIRPGQFICDTKTKHRFNIGTFIRAVSDRL